MSFFDKFPYTNFHELNLDWIISQLATVKDSMLKAVESAKNAKISETNAKTSETNAKTSADNAKDSETKAKTSETNAKISETNAKTSQDESLQNAFDAANYNLNIIRLVDNLNSETLPEMSRIEDAATDAKNEAINAKTSAKTSETNAKASETNAKTSETNASASASRAQSAASSVASTVYYYDTGEIDCTQGVSERGLALTMRVILRNGFMYIYGTLAPNVTETTKLAGEPFTIKGGIIGLKYNTLDIKEWIDNKLPNIDWDNLCGSCLLHGHGEVAVYDASTSQVISPKISLETIGGIYYHSTQTSSGKKAYLLSVRIEEMLLSYIDSYVKYDSSNCVSRYTLIMPIKFK